MAEKNNIDKLRQQGWEEMSTLLDTHMPTGKKRPVIWWYWLAGAAVLALLITASWPFFMNDTPTHSSVITSIDNPIIEKEITKPESSDKDINVPEIPATTDLNDVASTAKIPANRTARTIAPTKPITENRHTAYSGSTQNPATDSEFHKMGSTKNSAFSSESPQEQLSNESATHSIQTSIASDLSRREFLIARPGMGLSTYAYNAMKPIDVRSVKGHVNILAFSEMMWALSDHFGFLNIGPGLEYDFGKWTLGLSGGIVIPLPRQKSFNDYNEPFSKLYNFRQEMYSPNYDYNAGLSNSGNVVYYENYTMKPGFKIDLSAFVQISPHWSFGMDAGHVGYGWDFTQMAIPNQNVSARTDLTNLKSGLWYGGIAAGFEASSHWKLKGGVRFINPGDPENIGVIPTARLEYRF